MAIASNYPNLRPSLLLDFAEGQQLDPRVTFSRSTIGLYYDGKTSALAEQNLFTYSQDFTQSVWTKNSATVTASATSAPDGTTTGQKIISTVTALSSHLIYYNFSGFALTGNIVSVYVKSAEYSLFQICDASLGNINVYFDLTAVTSTITLGCSSSSITSVGGGWYRCVANLSIALTSSSRITFSGYPSSGLTPSAYGNTFIGDGTSGIYIWGAQLEQRSSVTAYNATTTTAFTNYIPQLLTAPINQPRFDFNPTTNESLGLLIEQSSTNLLTYSQDFSNAVWTKPSATIIANANIAPDGTQTAQLLVESTNSTSHGFYSTVFNIQTNGQLYTQSIYVKSKERTWILLEPSYTTTPTITAYFNIGTGAIGTLTNCTATITSVGNGWYRCTATYTATVTRSNIIGGVYLATGDGGGVYTGNGYSGLYIWQNQFENLAFATSPIATTSAQATRAADPPAKMLGSYFTGWFNYQQGTIYCSFDTPTVSASAPNMAIWGIDNGTTGQYYVNKSTSTLSGYEGTNNASFGTITANTNQQCIYAYSNVSGSQSASGLLNGGSIGAITATTQSILPTQLTIGGYTTTNNQFTGHIKKISYYPQALTSAQLQALTGS